MEEGVKWNKPGKGTRDGICEYLRWTGGKKKYIVCVCVCVQAHMCAYMLMPVCTWDVG